MYDSLVHLLTFVMYLYNSKWNEIISHKCLCVGLLAMFMYSACTYISLWHWQNRFECVYLLALIHSITFNHTAIEQLWFTSHHRSAATLWVKLELVFKRCLVNLVKTIDLIFTCIAGLHRFQDLLVSGSRMRIAKYYLGPLQFYMEVTIIIKTSV